VVVRVRRAVVILALVVLASLFVSVDERRVIVVVLVIVGPVLELAERPTGVVVGDVIVVVRVHDPWVGVLVFDVTRHPLHRLLGHGRTSRHWDRQDITLTRVTSPTVRTASATPYRALAVP
jgi:hypothetical protein